MLKDHLWPDEKIGFQRTSPGIKINGKPYETMVISDRRIIFYRIGELYKRDIVESIELHHVTDVKFKTRGLFKKTGALEIQTDSRDLIEGSLFDIKPAFSALSKYANQGEVEDEDEYDDE